jgi:uncharacterized membrane protein
MSVFVSGSALQSLLAFVSQLPLAFVSGFALQSLLMYWLGKALQMGWALKSPSEWKWM